MLANSVKPDFLIIGATKAATTSLSSLLQQHPDADMVYGKEPQFFSFDSQYSRGWDYYQSLYNHCKENAVVFGDASTSYSRIRYHPSVIQRIKLHIPNVKIIYMVRHPLERMESAYVQHVAAAGSNGLVFNSINETIIHQPMIIDSSRYWEVFDAYRKQFPEEHIKIVWFDEYINDRASVYQDICRFLGIQDDIKVNLDNENTNARSVVLDKINRSGRNDIVINTTWKPDIRKQVIDEIRVDNLRFLQYFGRPANYWGDLFD